MKKKILLAIAILFVGIQFFRIDMENPDVESEKDFLVITNAPEDITKMIKNACYDCHSNETTYPWYAQIAPVSWWLKGHIDDGRRHLNFSDWGNYPPKKADHKLEECIEEVKEDEMPLNSYTWTHSDAQLSEAEKTTLLQFFQQVRSAIVIKNVGKD